MRWIQFLAVVAVVAALARAQAPLFQVLDDPLPHDAFGDAIADLDGDGDVDLLNQLGIYTNDGNARFSGPTPCLLSFPRKRTLLADLNGDGLRDCISIDGFNNLRIDFNSGGLTFTGPTFGPPVSSPWVASSLSAADVDLDGDVDLLIGLQQAPPSNTIGIPVLWLNGGSGTFTQAPSSQLPALQAQATLTRDLDGNGYPDALYTITAGSNLIVAFNAGGVFTASATAQWAVPGLYPAGSVLASDFNGDGLVDLAVASIVFNQGVSVNFNSPTGFTGFSTGTGGQVSALQAVDVNGDGADELLVSNYDPSYLNHLSLHAVLPSGILGPALQPLPAMSFWSFWGAAPGGPDAVQDLDGDGDRDLIVVSGRTPMLLMNDGNGSLVPVGGHAPGVMTGLPQVGHVDGDGAPDIFGFRYPQASTSSWFVTGINGGDGFFHLGTSAALALPFSYPSFYSLYAFDRDGDGDSDIFAAANFLTASTFPPSSDQLFDNVGGTFVPSLTVPSAGSVVALQAFDFDSDGDQDVLMARRNYVNTSGITGPSRYISNNGPAGMAASVAVGGNHSSYDLDLGDFDGNGTMDAFQTNKEYGAVPPDPCVVYLNPGNAAFVPVAQSFSGWFAAAGELNGDNMTDLVVDGTVYFATGGGAFAPGPQLPAALVAKSVLADVDLDGDLDLVETPATIMLNQGGGIFAPPVSFLPLVAYVPWSWEIPTSTVVDVDRDGDPDIVAPGPVVVTNVKRQLAHGSWARLGRPASIELSGTAGGPWYLFASAATALIPAVPFGYALIDPASAVLFAAGGFDSSGAANVSATVPTNPGLVGWTSYWQGVDAATLKATNRIAITVLSY